MARSSTTYLGYPMKTSLIFDMPSVQVMWNSNVGNPLEGETQDSAAITTLMMIIRYRTPYIGFGGGFVGPVCVRRNGKIVLTATTFEELKQKLTEEGLLKDDLGLTLDYRFDVEDFE